MVPRKIPFVFGLRHVFERRSFKKYLCLNRFDEVPEGLKQDWIEVIHIGRILEMHLDFLSFLA